MAKTKYQKMLKKYPNATIYHAFNENESEDYNIVFCLACNVYSDCPDWGDDPRDFYKNVTNKKLLHDMDGIITCDECCGCGGW